MWEAAKLPTFHLSVASCARSYNVGGSEAADIPRFSREQARSHKMADPRFT